MKINFRIKIIKKRRVFQQQQKIEIVQKGEQFFSRERDIQNFSKV